MTATGSSGGPEVRGQWCERGRECSVSILDVIGVPEREVRVTVTRSVCWAVRRRRPVLFSSHSQLDVLAGRDCELRGREDRELGVLGCGVGSVLPWGGRGYGHNQLAGGALGGAADAERRR